MKFIPVRRLVRALRPSGAAAAATLSLALVGPLAAADFRVATKIYVGDGEESVSETLTIFQKGRVYDLPSGEGAVWTVMEPLERRFVVLRPDTKQKAVVSFEELAVLTDQMQKIGLEGKHASIFQPKLAASNEAETNRLVMQNDAMKYCVKALQPTDTEIPAMYRSFGDWFAKLNARYSRNFPPFGRLELNAALAERAIVPTEIEWTLLPRGQVFQTTVLRSAHDYQWTLSTRDEQKVKEAQSHLVSFKEVTFRELFPDALAAASEAAKR